MNNRIYEEIATELTNAFTIGSDVCLVRFNYRTMTYQVFLTIEYMDQVESANRNPDTVRVQIIKAASYVAKRHYIDLELMWPGGQPSTMCEK